MFRRRYSQEREARNEARRDVSPSTPGKSIRAPSCGPPTRSIPLRARLLVEVDLDNRKGELFPGSLAQVHFKTAFVGQSYIVPIAALIFGREGMRVAVVVNDGATTKAHLAPVVIGEDDGATVQISSGLNANDRMIQDPPDSLIEGEKVTVVNPGKPLQCGRTSNDAGVRAGRQESNIRIRRHRERRLRCAQQCLLLRLSWPLLAGCKPVGPDYKRPGLPGARDLQGERSIRSRRAAAESRRRRLAPGQSF